MRKYIVRLRIKKKVGSELYDLYEKARGVLVKYM